MRKVGVCVCVCMHVCMYVALLPFLVFCLLARTSGSPDSGRLAFKRCIVAETTHQIKTILDG